MTHIDLMHLPLISLAAVLAALFVAGMTKGLLGIGMPIIAVPLLNLVVDLRVTVALLAIPLIITNIPQAIRGHRIPVVLRRLYPILAGMVVGVAIGVTILSITDPAYLKPVVGIILIAVTALMWFAPKFALSARVRTLCQPVRRRARRSCGWSRGPSWSFCFRLSARPWIEARSIRAIFIDVSCPRRGGHDGVPGRARRDGLERRSYLNARNAADIRRHVGRCIRPAICFPRAF